MVADHKSITDPQHWNLLRARNFIYELIGGALEWEK